MSPIPVNLAVEDDLSEWVLRALINFVDREYFIGTTYGRNGFGYLRRTVRGWNTAARGIPFVLLTDLDKIACPPTLIQEWLGVPLHPNLIFRIAVREVESWLLADIRNLASFLTVRQNVIPTNCDALDDPKAELVKVASRARSRDIRDRIVPSVGSTAKQGPDYNGCLGVFVRDHWDIGEACAASSSLNRAFQKLRTFEPTWPKIPFQ
jgi:hypothetical protein